MQITTGFAEVNGTRLYYESAGTGQPLVFIHGFTMDTRMWDDQFAHFAPHYRVVRYDMRGFGQSAVPDGSRYSNVEDLKALLAHLAIERPILIGLSRGGSVALNFALAYPDALLALVVIDTVLDGFNWSEEASSRDRFVWQEARRGGLPAAKAAWISHPLFVPLMQNPPAAERFTQIVNDYSGWHFLNRNTEQHLEPPAAQRLKELHTPLLIITGEHDIPDFRAIADLIHQQVPGSQAVIVPGAGHMSNMESPAFVSATIERWLNAL